MCTKVQCSNVHVMSTSYEEVCGHLLYYVNGKNANWNNTFLLKMIKNGINYCVFPTSCPFSNFPSVIHVEQLTVSTMMLEEAQFMEFW